MTITVNAASPAINAVAGTTLSVPYPSGIAAGDFLRLMVSTNDNTASSVTSGLTGWTIEKAAAANSNANAPSLTVAWKLASGSETGSLAVGTVTAKSFGQITAYRGVDQTTPLDVASGFKDVGTAAATVAFLALTTVTDGALLDYSAAQNSTTATATPPAGFTETSDNSGTAWSGTTGYKIQATHGSTGTVTVTFSATNRGLGVLMVLRPAVTPVATSGEFLMFGN